ncbi:MAG: hypothetical protein FH761_16155 [Firmicutes bacterium]|nr:hypothetical protein [Bacillota bacterium]
MVCASKENGDKIWESKIFNYHVIDVIPTDKYVFIKRADGKVIAFDKFTGERLWEYIADDGSEDTYSYLAYKNNTLVVAGKENKLYIFDISDVDK